MRHGVATGTLQTHGLDEYNAAILYLFNGEAYNLESSGLLLLAQLLHAQGQRPVVYGQRQYQRS